MENEDQEFWRALLANRNLRSRFIRDLEIQSIASRSPEDLASRYHGEEILPGQAMASRQSSATSASW